MLDMGQDAAQDLEAFLGKDRFGTVLADPPWRFVNRTGKVAPEHKRLARYPTMELADICALPVADHLEDRAHCYLWVPNALSARGAASAERLGLRLQVEHYLAQNSAKTAARMGAASGFYFRNVTEILLFGTRGKNVRTEAPGRRQVNMIQSPGNANTPASPTNNIG